MNRDLFETWQVYHPVNETFWNIEEAKMSIGSCRNNDIVSFNEATTKETTSRIFSSCNKATFPAQRIQPIQLTLERSSDKYTLMTE